MRLKDKVAIITGSGQGIGKTTALTFAREGAAVVVSDVTEELVKNAVAEILDAGGVALGQVCDVTNRVQVQAMAQNTLQEFGKIDILLNNAGIIRDSQLIKMTEAEWDIVINVNLKGVFNCTQAVAKPMLEAGYGRIINTSSIVAIFGNFGQTNYAATKGGIISMTKVWARELGPRGITVNAVAPGFIGTDIIKSIPQKVLQTMIDKTPLKRLGEPQEVANVHLFLASEEASFLNGQCLIVDGGIGL